MAWKDLLLSKEYHYHKESGERYLTQGSLGEARIEFEKALEILRKAKTSEELKLEGKLKEISQKLTEQSLDRARQYWAEGELAHALNFFQNALGTVRNQQMKENVLIEISRLKLEMEPLEQIQALEEEVQANPSAVDTLFDLAMEYALNGYFEKAIFELKKVLEQDPGNEEALLRIGNACADANRYLEAIDYYRRGLELRGDIQSQFHYRLGIIYKLSGQVHEAEASFLKCIQEESEHLDALMSLARLYTTTNQREQAIDYYERVLSLDPDDGETLLRVASLWEDGGYIKNAREIWEEILEKKCDDLFKEEAKERLTFYETQI